MLKTLFGLLCTAALTIMVVRKLAHQREPLAIRLLERPAQDDSGMIPIEEDLWPEDEDAPTRLHTNPPQSCWCQADLVLTLDNGMEVWAHHGPGDTLLSGRELVEAINQALRGEADDC